MSGEYIESCIVDLANTLLSEGMSEKFRLQARGHAGALSVGDLSELKRRLHTPPSESPFYDVESHGLGGWLSACQGGIFELVFSLGEGALPFLREIAWGKYDWTQGNAIELLIRLAADGVRREELVSEIRGNFPRVRFEAQLYAIGPLVKLAVEDRNLASVIEDLMSIGDFRDAYLEVSAS